VFAYDVPHEVRCCSDVAKDGWTKRSGCNVWVESNFGVCHRNKNFLEAECICEKYDARLCTKAEIEGNCSRGTGCGMDNQLVWTSTPDDSADTVPTSVPTPVPTLPPTLPVAEQCASETDGDSTTLNYWALCGRQGAGRRCSNEPDDVFAYDVPHEVRCCSDVAKDGWTKRSGCNVWVESNFGVCHRNKNFLEAECICEKYDARLCTKAEIEGNCSRGTGCGMDNQLVWTSTEE